MRFAFGVLFVADAVVSDMLCDGVACIKRQLHVAVLTDRLEHLRSLVMMAEAASEAAKSKLHWHVVSTRRKEDVVAAVGFERIPGSFEVTMISSRLH